MISEQAPVLQKLNLRHLGYTNRLNESSKVGVLSAIAAGALLAYGCVWTDLSFGYLLIAIVFGRIILGNIKLGARIVICNVLSRLNYTMFTLPLALEGFRRETFYLLLITGLVIDSFRYVQLRRKSWMLPKLEQEIVDSWHSGESLPAKTWHDVTLRRVLPIWLAFDLLVVFSTSLRTSLGKLQQTSFGWLIPKLAGFFPIATTPLRSAFSSGHMEVVREASTILLITSIFSFALPLLYVFGGSQRLARAIARSMPAILNQNKKTLQSELSLLYAAFAIVATFAYGVLTLFSNIVRENRPSDLDPMGFNSVPLAFLWIQVAQMLVPISIGSLCGGLSMWHAIIKHAYLAASTKSIG